MGGLSLFCATTNHCSNAANGELLYRDLRYATIARERSNPIQKFANSARA
jgi:hypothetical protein